MLNPKKTRSKEKHMNKQNIILDYGCGKGGNAPLLAKRGQYVGIDVLPENIEYAKKAQKDYHFAITSNEGRIPCESASVSEIHTYEVLEHVDDLEQTFEEFARLTFPGSSMYGTVPAAISEKFLLHAQPNYFPSIHHVRIVDIDKLKRELEEKGFLLVKTRKDGGMEAVMLSLLFWFAKRDSTLIDFQTGSPRYSKLLVAWMWLFDCRLFRTKLKYFFPIYAFTLPIGWIISQWYPKFIWFHFVKIR